MSERCPFANPPPLRTGPWLVCSRHLIRHGRQRGRAYECQRCAEARERAARNIGVGIALAGAIAYERTLAWTYVLAIAWAHSMNPDLTTAGEVATKFGDIAKALRSGEHHGGSCDG
jgi:hypothetical protein